MSHQLIFHISLLFSVFSYIFLVESASSQVYVRIDDECVPANELLGLCAQRLQQELSTLEASGVGQPASGSPTIEMDSEFSCAFYAPWINQGGEETGNIDEKNASGRIGGSVCTPPTEPKKCETSIDNPIESLRGNKYQHEVDISSYIEPEVKIERWYNSIGGSWTFFPSVNFKRGVPVGSISRVYVVRPDGRIIYFVNDGNTFRTDFSSSEKLTYQPKNGVTWEFTYPGGLERFDSRGRIIFRKNGFGLAQTFNYNGNKFTVSTDRGVHFTVFTEAAVPADTYTLIPGFEGSYAPQRIIKVSTADGHDYRYEYDPVLGFLDRVIYPDDTPNNLMDNPFRQYHYADSPPDANGVSLYRRLLHGITDERGHRYIEWGYDDQGRANRSTKFDYQGGAPCSCAQTSCVGVCPVISTYFIDFTRSGSGGASIATNPMGKQTVFHYSDWIKGGLDTGIRLLTRIEGKLTSQCAATDAYRTYYAYNGKLESSTDNNGNVTLYKYYPDGRLSKKIEGLKWFSGTPSYGIGVPKQGTITTSATRSTHYCWQTGQDFPAKEIHDAYVIKRQSLNGKVIKESRMARYQNDLYCSDAPPDSTPHRYWRLIDFRFRNAPGHVPDRFSVREMEFTGVDGSGLEAVLSLSGLVASTYIASVASDSGNSNAVGVDACFDSDFDSSCSYDGYQAIASDFVISFDLGVGNESNLIGFREEATSDLTRVATGFTLQYSDDGANWVTKTVVDGIAMPSPNSWSRLYDLTILPFEQEMKNQNPQPTDSNPHRYWRLSNLTFPNGFADYFEPSELEFGTIDQVSGNVVAIPLLGLVSSSYPLANAFSINHCFDDYVDTSCAFSGANAMAVDFYLIIDLGASNEKNVSSIRQATYDNITRYVSGFDVEYSDDGSNWFLKKSVSGLWIPGVKEWSQPVDLSQ